MNRAPLKYVKPVAVAFDEPLHDALKKLSADTEQSFAKLVRRACCYWLTSPDAEKLRASARDEQAVHRSFLMAASTPEEKAETKKFVKGVK